MPQDGHELSAQQLYGVPWQTPWRVLSDLLADRDAGLDVGSDRVAAQPRVARPRTIGMDTSAWTDRPPVARPLAALGGVLAAAGGLAAGQLVAGAIRSASRRRRQQQIHGTRLLRDGSH